MLDRYQINTGIDGNLGDMGPPPLPSGQYVLRLMQWREREVGNRDVYLDMDFAVVQGPSGVSPQSQHRESILIYSAENRDISRARRFFKGMFAAVGLPAGMNASEDAMHKVRQVNLSCELRYQEAGVSKKTGKNYPARTNIERFDAAVGGQPQQAAMAAPAAPQMTFQPNFAAPPAPPANNVVPMQGYGNPAPAPFSGSPAFQPATIPPTHHSVGRGHNNHGGMSNDMPSWMGDSQPR